MGVGVGVGAESFLSEADGGGLEFFLSEVNGGGLFWGLGARVGAMQGTVVAFLGCLHGWL